MARKNIVLYVNFVFQCFVLKFGFILMVDFCVSFYVPIWFLRLAQLNVFELSW